MTRKEKISVVLFTVSSVCLVLLGFLLGYLLHYEVAVNNSFPILSSNFGYQFLYGAIVTGFIVDGIIFINSLVYLIYRLFKKENNN